MRKYAVRILWLTMVCQALTAQAEDTTADALFHIERNKNANIVQYDAQVTRDGKLDSKTPVVAYWVRLANEGERKELTWVQQKFAYGFTAELTRDRNAAELDMAADLGRTISVRKTNDDYRAVADINGTSSYIDKIFIHSSGSGMSTKVNYIELHGTSISDRSEQFERFTP